MSAENLFRKLPRHDPKAKERQKRMRMRALPSDMSFTDDPQALATYLHPSISIGNLPETARLTYVYLRYMQTADLSKMLTYLVDPATSELAEHKSRLLGLMLEAKRSFDISHDVSEIQQSIRLGTSYPLVLEEMLTIYQGWQSSDGSAYQGGRSREIYLKIKHFPSGRFDPILVANKRTISEQDFLRRAWLLWHCNKLLRRDINRGLSKYYPSCVQGSDSVDLHSNFVRYLQGSASETSDYSKIFAFYNSISNPRQKELYSLFLEYVFAYAANHEYQNYTVKSFLHFVRGDLPIETLADFALYIHYRSALSNPNF